MEYLDDRKGRFKFCSLKFLHNPYRLPRPPQDFKDIIYTPLSAKPMGPYIGTARPSVPVCRGYYYYP
jgi:hypothetical protein